MKSLRIHVIQHVEFEKPALIEQWGKENNHTFSFSLLYKDQLLPDFKNFDLLVIMGGPMGVHDTDKYPWLKTELEFIRNSIKNEKAIIGICLGAQLLALALGEKVYKGPNKEIGWFPISWKDKTIPGIPEQSMVFHWHGDTFDIPAEAKHIASSEGVPNQAFIFRKNIVGLQFHLEVTSESIKLMLKNCADDITSGRYVQSMKEISKGLVVHTGTNKKLLYSILNYITEEI